MLNIAAFYCEIRSYSSLVTEKTFLKIPAQNVQKSNFDFKYLCQK